MIVHIVFFKYKADIDEAARRDHRTRLRGLATIDGISEMKVVEDVVRSPRSCDTGIIVTFRDRAALDAYQKNPVHVPVAQYGVSICESIASLDFEE
jgi:hypothetical protein